MARIRSWSFSRLSDYEKCPLLAKLKYLDRIPEPERKLPEGKTEHANDRGSRIHDECEQFVRGTRPFPKEAAYFREEFDSLQSRYKNGYVLLEHEWGFDDAWKECDWNRAWLRLKLDANIHLSNEHVAVVDYKTGKKFGNEIKHGEQTQLYGLSVFLRYPMVQRVTAELWYLDANDLTSLDITRSAGMRLLKPFDKRARCMTEDEVFKPNPNTYSCRYCPYHPATGSGDCPHGV